MCTPPDQSILVKTPRTSTPSLKTVVGNHIDKRLDHGETSSTCNKTGLDQSKEKAFTLSTKKTDQQAQSSNKTNQQGQSSYKTNRQDHNSKKTNQPGQDSKKTEQRGQISNKTDQQGHNSNKTNQPTQGSKKTDKQGQSSKITNQQGQNSKKADHQSSKKLCEKNKKDGFDDHKWVAPTKKSAPPLRVTEDNIDSFLNQLSTKPKPVTKKYTTRSSVKQSKVLEDKTQNKENVTKKEKSYNIISIKQQSASPVVKLQQAKCNRITELPQSSLSAFDFDDDEGVPVPVTKKARQVDTSVSSSCDSSLEMSRLNASLLARGNTSKSFSMTPQKKGRNKRSSPNKKPVSVCLT